MVSFETRPAATAELASMWPAVRSARLHTTFEEFVAFHAAAPWRVRINESGEAMVVAAWRAHMDLLAIRGLWAPRIRTEPLIGEVAAIARAHGFDRVLSPLLSESTVQPYLESGMCVAERIVALQGFSAEIGIGAAAPGITVRAATADDVAAIESIDVQCFDEFWRYGLPEIAETLRGHTTVVCDEDETPLGYATCTVQGGTAMLARLAVAPAARHRGAGRLLLAEAAAWATRREVFAFTLCTQESNSASRALYTSAGMYELPERYVLAQREISAPVRRSPIEDKL